MYPRMLVVLVIGLLGMTWMDTSEAVPAFARKYDKQCSSCHTAWPMLNKAGRMFKEAGYKFPGPSKNINIGDDIELDSVLPISAILVARPYDKKDSGEAKLRALHEVEIIFAGNMAKDFSGYFEIEAEDETGFEPEVGPAVLGFHPSKALNILVAYGPMLWADPYSSYSDHQRLTRGHYSVLDQRFGNADGNGGVPDFEGKRLRDARQNLIVSGRLTDPFFYSVTISGVGGDAEGEKPAVYTGRAVFDVTNKLSVGALVISGKCDGQTAGCTVAERSFSRTGLDVQADIADFRVNAVYVSAKDDDITGTTEEKNNAYYVQGLYVNKEGKHPRWVPLLRYDSYEKADGADEYKELTANVSYYFRENAKIFLEYWKQLDVPSGETEDNRTTLQFAVAF